MTFRTNGTTSVHEEIIWLQSKKSDVQEGCKVSFDCTVKGKPLPEIKWYALLNI